MRNREEEIGKIYGCYKILEFCNNQTCICECQKCGNVRSVDFYHLKDRNYEYCDKCVRPRKLKYDLVHKTPIDGLNTNADGSYVTDEQSMGVSYDDIHKYVRMRNELSQETIDYISGREKKNLFKLQLMPKFNPNL